jgi:heme-degrading monooxygenase HmoA
MFMRIAWVRVRPGRWADFEVRYADQAKTVPGLKGRWLSRDVSDPDSIYVVSLWESIESLAAWEESDYFTTVLMPGIKPLVEAGLTVSVCEVQHAQVPNMPDFK